MSHDPSEIIPKCLFIMSVETVVLLKEKSITCSKNNCLYIAQFYTTQVAQSASQSQAIKHKKITEINISTLHKDTLTITRLKKLSI